MMPEATTRPVWLRIWQSARQASELPSVVAMHTAVDEMATRRRAKWAVLPLDVECAPGWKLDVRSPPWGVYRQVSGVSCR